MAIRQPDDEVGRRDDNKTTTMLALTTSNAIRNVRVNDDGVLFAVLTDGSGRYDNPAYDTYEDEDSPSQFATSVMYGYDVVGTTGLRLASLHVAEAGDRLGDYPHVLVTGGIYREGGFASYENTEAVPLTFDITGRLHTNTLLTDDTGAYPATALDADGQTSIMALVKVGGLYESNLPVYDDQDAAIAHMDINGRWLVHNDLLTYIDDSLFEVGIDRIMGIGYLANELQPDSVNETDIGMPRMTYDRKPFTAHTYAHSAVASTYAGMIALEAATFDGTLLGNVVDEGDVVRAKGSEYGIFYNYLTRYDGSSSPQIDHSDPIDYGDNGEGRQVVMAGAEAQTIGNFSPVDSGDATRIMASPEGILYHTILTPDGLEIAVVADGDMHVPLPGFVSGGGIHRTTQPTYVDQDAVIFHFTDRGRLMTQTEVYLNDYVDDSAFTTDVDYVLAMGAYVDEFDPDNVDDGNIGLMRMTRDRKLYTAHTQLHSVVAECHVGVIAAEAVDVGGASMDTVAVNDVIRLKATEAGMLLTIPATDDGGAVATLAYDAAIAGSAGTAVLMVGSEAKDQDGSAFPNAISEGDAGRQSISLHGVQHNLLIKKDGSSTPQIDHNSVIDDTSNGEGRGVVLSGAESYTIDGETAPNVVAEGDAVRIKATPEGIQTVILVSPDGSQTPYSSVDNNIQVTETNDARQSTTYTNVQTATALGDLSENQIGGNFNVAMMNIANFGMAWVRNAAEASPTIRVYGIMVTGGSEYLLGTWGTGATSAETKDDFVLSDGVNASLPVLCAQWPLLKFTAQGYDAAGTLALELYVANSA